MMQEIRDWFKKHVTCGLRALPHHHAGLDPASSSEFEDWIQAFARMTELSNPPRRVQMGSFYGKKFFQVDFSPLVKNTRATTYDSRQRPRPANCSQLVVILWGLKESEAEEPTRRRASGWGTVFMRD